MDTIGISNVLFKIHGSNIFYNMLLLETTKVYRVELSYYGKIFVIAPVLILNRLSKFRHPLKVAVSYVIYLRPSKVPINPFRI